MRELKFLLRCTPVVCTGGPPKLAKPPNKSVKPLNADKLFNAFNAPGFDNNCANGIADASGFVAVTGVVAGGVGIVDVPVVGEVLFVAVFVS